MDAQEKTILGKVTAGAKAPREKCVVKDQQGSRGRGGTGRGGRRGQRGRRVGTGMDGISSHGVLGVTWC